MSVAETPSPSGHLRAVPARREGRHLTRRSLYIGEGLTAELTFAFGTATGELIDMTPEGLGIAITSGGALPVVGDVVTVEHTGAVTTGIRHVAKVQSVSEMRVAGRMLPRIGLSIVVEHTPGGHTKERRGAARHACPEDLPVSASARCPLFFREWLHFGVTEVGAGGMTLKASIRNKALLAGLEMAFTLTLPISGNQQVRGRITSVQRDGARFVVGVAWVEPSRELLHAVSEYLLLGNKDLTPAGLREGGLKVGSIERAVTYDYASGPADHAAILKLRLCAHKAEERLTEATTADMASPYDAHSRHLTCRFGRDIIGYVRVIYVDGDPARSQYVTEGQHEVPEWLWKAGFVEAGAGATHPEFQRAGLFLPLMQHAVRVAAQSGYRYVLGACTDELLDMYQQMGFEVLEAREVEPKPGWRFRSHLICLDVEKLVNDPPPGKAVDAMASAVSFAASARR